MANDNKDRWYTLTTSDGKDHKLYQKDLDEYGWGGYAKAYPEATVVMSDPDGGLWDVDLREVGEKRKQGYKFNANVPAQKVSQPTKTTTQPKQATQQQPVVKSEGPDDNIYTGTDGSIDDDAKRSFEDTLRSLGRNVRTQQSGKGIVKTVNRDVERSRRMVEAREEREPELGLDVNEAQTEIDPHKGAEQRESESYIGQATEKMAQRAYAYGMQDSQIDDELIKAEEKLQAAVARISSSPNFMLDQARMAVVGDKMGGGNMDPYERDAEYRLLKTRIRQLKQAKEFNRLGAEVFKNNGNRTENSFSLFSGDSWARFGKNAWEGIKSAGTNVENIPLVGGFTSLNDMAQKVALANKVSNGEELTEDEQDLLTAFALADAAEGRNQFALSNWGYMAGSGGVQMLSFMADLALSPTSGLARAGANKATTFVAKKLLKKYGNEGVRKIANKVLTYAAQQGARVAGAVVNGGIVTPLTTQLPKTMSEVLSRNAGQAVIDTDDSGRYVGKGFEGGEEAGDAIIHGIVSQGIENVSEEILAGTGASKGLGKLMKSLGLAKGGAHASKFTSSLVDYLTTADDMALKGPVAKWRMAGKFGSPLEEILEEYAAIPMQHAAGLSEYNGTAWEEIKDPETFYNIVAGLSLGMGFMEGSTLLVDKGSKAAARGINNLVTSRRLNKSDIAAQNIFGDRWEGIKETIESYTDDNIGSGINSLLNTFKDADEKQAAWRYLVDLQAYRGANLARQKAHGEEAKNDFAAAQEEALEKGYSTTQALSRINIKKTLDYLSEKNGALIEEGLEYFGSPEALVRDMEGWASPEDIQQVMDYLNAKALYEGVVTRISDDMEGQIDAMNHNVEAMTNPDTGGLQSAVLDPDKAAVNHLDPALNYHIISGEVWALEDGTLDVENSSKNVILLDSNGEKHFVPAEVVSYVGPVFSPEGVKIALQQDIEEQYAKKLKTGEEGIAPFVQGDLYTFNDGTWQVQSNNEDEEGGKIVFYNTETGEVRALTRDEAQKAFDAAANIAIAEANGGTPTATPEEASLPEGSLQPEGADILSATADGQQVMQQVDEWLANDPEEVEENINDMVPEQYRDAALAYYQSKLNLQGAQQTEGNTPVVTGTAQPVQPTASAAPKKVELPRNEDGEFDVKKHKKTADADSMAQALVSEFGNEGAMAVAQGYRADALNKKTKRPEQKIYAMRDAAYWADVISRLNELNPQAPVITPQPTGQAPTTPNVGGENARAKWDFVPKVEGRTAQVRLKDGRKVKGHFVVAPAGVATASHTANFQDNPDFIHNADGRSMNPRDYTQPANQASVTAIANDYQLQNYQIVSEDGIVYDGNGRQIAGDIAARQGTDGKYVEDLVDNADMYGIDASQLEGMEHPRLYFQVDEGQLDYSPQTFDMFNASEQKEVGAVEQGTAMAMTVTDPTFNTLSNIIAGVDGGLKGVYRSTVAQREVINAMQEASDIKEVNQQTRPRYFNDTDGTLTEAGRILLESALVGKLFGKNAEVIQMLSTMPRVRNAIAQAMPDLLENNKLGEYSLIDEVAQAIKAIYSAREAGQSLQDYMLQGDLFEGKAGKEVYGATVELMANILNGDENVTLQEVLAGSEENDGYNKKASIALNYGSLLFGDNRSREEIITEIIEPINPELAKKYGIRKQAESAGEQTPVAENGGSSSQGEEAAEQPGEESLEEWTRRTVEAARNGDVQAQQKLESFGLPWKKKPVVRFVAKGEVDNILNGGRYEGRFGDGRVDVTNSTDATTAATAAYRIVFKEDLDWAWSERLQMKKEELGDGWLKGGYSLDDVATIEELQPDGTYKEIYNEKEGRKNNNQENSEKNTPQDNWRFELHYDRETGRVEITREKVGPSGIPIGDGRWRITAKSLAEMRGILENPANNLKAVYDQVEARLHNEEQLEALRKEEQQAKQEESTETAPQAAESTLSNGRTAEENARLEELKARLRKKLFGQLNSGFDPELFAIGAEIAFLHIKGGLRKFDAFARQMIADFGDTIRPLLKSFYNGARDFPGMEEYRADMTSSEDVAKFDVANFDKSVPDIMAGAEVAVNERKVEQAAKEIEEASVRKEADAEKYRAFSQSVAADMLAAMETGEKPYKSIKDIRAKAKSLGLEIDDNGRDDILLQELVEDGLVNAARKYVSQYLIMAALGSKKISEVRKSKALFDEVVRLYELQPTLSQRSSNRIKMQQYSTPLPMSFIADMFAFREGMHDVLEPTAGNGMLVFAIPESTVHANELDKTRLDNLRAQKFKKVTDQDATQPFEGGEQYDAVITNPPFGSTEAKEYDGKLISGLAPQIALNALAKMKDDGKAAIIIGGEQTYAKNGSIVGDKQFLTYLYDHYNVKGVVEMSGKLYAKQGTTYPTRLILIDGRRSEAEREQTKVYPPRQQEALRKAESFDDLYEIVNEVINSNDKTNGHEVLRSAGAPQRTNGVTQSGQLDLFGDTGQSNANDTNGRDGGKGTSVSGRSNSGNRGNEQGGVSSTPKQGSTRVSGLEPTAVHGGARDTGGNAVGTRGGNLPGGERTESDTRGSRSVDSGNAGRVQLDGTGKSVAVGQPGARVEQKPKEQRKLDQEKLPYRPHNTAFSLESVAPAAMVESMDATLAEIEKEVGDIDNFVRSELGYDTVEELHDALAAEQVDGVAMAIYQMKKGNAVVIGDQTGVGKGRQMAALIRWACKRGQKPIFITQKDDLFTDIYRDLVDVGSGDLRPFIFNASTVSKTKKPGEQPKCTGGVMLDEDGNLIYRSLGGDKQKQIFESGELPDEYDYAVLTYFQVSKGDAQSREEARQKAKKNGGRAKKKDDGKGKPTPKADFLRKIAKGNIMLLDESHTAAGESNTGAYLQSLVKDSAAVTFASATFAKRPDTMPLYALRTAMSEANVEADKLIGIIEKGGVTLQEIMSRALSECGQMVRRERDMSDVQTDWKTVADEETVKRARDNYDRTIKAFNAIIQFQEMFVAPKVAEADADMGWMGGTADLKQGTKKGGIDNPPFVNKTYNYTKQLLLALKVDAIVDEVEAEIKAGRHPVIALESTMESSLSDFSVGETIDEPTFSLSLLRGLDTVMQYTVKDEDGNETHATYSPSELGPEGERAYYALQQFIRESTQGIFISPLDAIIEKLNARGYKVGELTGRKTYLEKNSEGKATVKKRGKIDKKKLARDFNNRVLDVLILNKSASTGISLHASEKFTDQRQRTMIITQPLSDINDYMQMIGRIDRTGQVHRGYYINLGLPVPAESRFLMMLSTKLKSLNANTTTSQDSESNDVEAPDLLNKYGAQVILEYLRDNPDIYEKMGMPLGKQSEPVKTSELEEYTPKEEDANRITGRVALLSTAEQDAFYDEVVKRYNDLIKYLDETGTNDLKITVLPLRAKTLGKKISSEGKDPDGKNPFAGNAYVEAVEMDVLRKPMKADEVRKVLAQLSAPKGTPKARLPFAAQERMVGDRTLEIIATIESETRDKMQAEEERYARDQEKVEEGIRKKAEKINASTKATAEEKQAAIETFATEQRNKSQEGHENRVNAISYLTQSFTNRLTWFHPGQTYLVPDDLEKEAYLFTSPAIFCGYKAKDSKITPSTTFAVFATLDGRRRIEVKMSQLGPLTHIKGATDNNLDAARQTNLDNWDSQIPANTRKKGFIMTGNILQAVQDTRDMNGNYPGQLISFTDENGNVRDGILMPEAWTPGKLATAGAPIMSRIEQIKSLTWRDAPITSTDGKVQIEGERYGDYFLRVPKSKKEGGQYYLNDELLKLVRNNGFFTRGGSMIAEVYEGNIEEVVKILSNMGVRVSVESDDKMDDTRFRSTESEEGGVTEKEGENSLPVNENSLYLQKKKIQDEPESRDQQIARLAGGNDSVREILSSSYDRGSNSPRKEEQRRNRTEGQPLYGEIVQRAKENGSYIEDLTPFVSKGLSNGQESIVYLSSDGKSVVKVNNLDFYKDKPDGIKQFVSRLLAHNALFPKDAYVVLGFTSDKDGNLRVVLSQPYVKGRNATSAEIDNFLESAGFEIDITDEWFDGRFVIGDTKEANAMIDEDGEFRAIDFTVSEEPIIGRRPMFRSEEGERPSVTDKEEIRAQAQQLADSLNVPVAIVNDVSELPEALRKKVEAEKERSRKKTGRANNVPGVYYNGKVYVVLSDCQDVTDGVRTILHEIVGHKGLRELLGNDYKDFLLGLHAMLSEADRKALAEKAERYGWNIVKAMDEWLAEKAEDSTDYTFWDKVAKFVNDFLRKFVGIDVALNDSDVRYILWRSRQKLTQDDDFDFAKDRLFKNTVEKAKATEREKVQSQEEGIEDTRFRLREKPEPKKTGKGYKVFFLKDGKLYPPMVANPNGEETPVGVWLDADAAPIVGQTKTGRNQVKAGGKGTQGGSGSLSYRPGWHLGTIPYALQFNRKNGETGNADLFPKDFVWAEVEYADDVNYQQEAHDAGVNANGKYQHSLAGLQRVPEDGSYTYRTNPNPQTDPWIITGAMKVNRILTPSEVDDMVREAGREPQKRQEGAVTDEQVNELNRQLGLDTEEDDIAFRSTPANAANNSKSVRQAYDELMRSGRFLAKETLVDYLASVEKLQSLIEKKTGQKLIDTQNVYRRMFSAIRRSEDGVKFFTSFCAEPLYKAIFDIAGNADFSTNKKAERLDRYCRVKHGIERNRDMAVLEHLDEVAQREFSEQMETELSDLTTKAANLSLEINDLIARREDAKSRGDRSLVRDIQDQINLKREELRAVNAEKKGKMRFPEKYGLKSLQTIKEEKRAEWYDAVEAERELRKSIGASWRETQEALDELAEETFGVELGKEYAGVGATLDAMGEKDAYSFVENFENEVGAQKINALWDAIRLASGVSLEKQLETGLVDKDYVIQQQRRYEYYVPLRGFKGVVASDVYDYPGEGVRGVGNPVIAAGGRESEADNCFGNLLSIGYRSITSGNHNQALQAFWNLARSGKSDGLLVGNRVWIENVGTDEDPDWVMAEAEIPDNATAEEVARILEEFEEEMKEKQKLGLAVQQHKGTPLPPYRTLNKAEKNAHHVYVYIGGELRVVTVVGNPRVALALNGVLNPESTQWKWEQTLNNFLAGAFTSDNPSFAAANLVRDTLHSNARVFIMENPKFWAKFTMKQAGYGLVGASLVYNWGKMMNLLQWYGTYQQSGKKLSFDQEAKRLRFKGVSGETLKNFVRFMELGGATGYIWAKDDVESLREIESALSDLAHPTKTTIKKYNPFRLFEFASEASELVNRFIAFETGLEMGKTEQQAVSDAQELTLNFTRKGAGRKTSQAMTLDTSKMKVGERTKRSLVDALAGISQFGRNHIVFWNAHMQGAYQLKDMAWKHPGKTFVAYAAAPTVMAGLLMPVMNNVLLPGLYAAFGYGGGDDDDKKYNYYDELPDYIRQRNVCIRKPGGGWIMIPLTPEFAAVWSIGDAMGGTQYGRPVKSSEVILPMLDIISPTTIDWNQGMGGVFVGFTPTGLQPIAHTLINRDWKGQKIKNETPWNEGLPEWKRTFNGTSPTLLAASKGWNRLTGGDNDTYISSSVDINPGTMKEFIQGYLGGFGTSTIDLCDYIYGTVDQEAEAARRDARLPIIGRFWLQGTQGQINQRVQSLYYERIGDFSKNVETREREMRKEVNNAYLKVDEVEEQLSEASAADIVKYEELEAQKKEYEKIAEKKEKILENYRESDEWQKFEDIKADVGYLKKMMRGKKAADLSEGEIGLMKELIEKVSKK